METKFEEWAILELMGHRRLAGKVTEAAILGGALLRIDIPSKDGNFESTQFYGPQAIYCLTPTSEAIARAVAAQSHPEPINRWEFPQLQRFEESDDEIEPDDVPDTLEDFERDMAES